MSSVHKFERGAGCQVCAFPLTDRHHLLPKSEFNRVFDNVEETFAHLCPNCHRIFHTVDGMCNSGKREFTTIDLVTMAANGEIARHIMPEILRLVIRSRSMRIDVLEEVERQFPDGNGISRNRETINQSHQVIRECRALVDFLATHGIRERSALDLMIGGAA